MGRLGWMRQSWIVPSHCSVEVFVGYHAVFVNVEGAESHHRLLYFRLCQLAKRARKAAIVLPPGLVVLYYPFGHTAANSAVRLPALAAHVRTAFWSFGWGVNVSERFSLLLRKEKKKR